MTLPPEEPGSAETPRNSRPGGDQGRDTSRRRAQGSFSRSLLDAAARGTGLIALAVAIGIVLLQYSDDPTENRLSAGRAPAVDAPLSASTSTTTTTAGARPAAEVRVLVVNASGRKGVAGEMAGRLGVVGYNTLEPANAPVRPQTTVGCRPGFEREAAALLSATGVPAETADPGDLLPPEADCVVVIGSA
ncbi:MAG: LytR C-terminal domain-containing protein [Actinomycetota bacterium]|nr:LytR C-terminal domain-containing protein [Actinomycetota bacterium]